MRLTNSEIDCLLAKYPELPVDYVGYLREVGWGDAPSGHMIYSGPISPTGVYPQLSGESNCVLIGDDRQGYCVGYDFGLKRFGELSPTGVWSSFPESFSLREYLFRD
jgi:hypothetical protein